MRWLKRDIYKKKKKPSMVSDMKKERIIKATVMVAGVMMLVVIGIFGIPKITYLASNITWGSEETKLTEAQVKELEYKESLHQERINTFYTLYDDFNKKQENFEYAVYVVETSSTIYFNDKAVQEMSKNVKHLKKRAEELQENADILKNTFRTPTGKKKASYSHQGETLNLDNTKKLQELYIELSDLTTQVNNSIVNVDFYNGYFELDGSRKKIVDAAESLVGKISYEWGAKATDPGWNKEWNTPGTGLDCSGFVQWAYWTGLNEYIEEIGSTYTISLTQQEISFKELLPGDLGMMYKDGTYYTDFNGNKFYSYEAAKASNIACGYPEDFVNVHSNHVGIYAGQDMDGNYIWIHCTGGNTNTVVKEEYPDFVYYYRVLGD